MTKTIVRRLRVNGVEIESYEWPADGPPLFFAHATGFHAHCWAQVIALLPEFRCIAIDMRGHGLSSKPAEAAAYAWRNFGLDAAAVLAALGIEGAIGVGHSKGGHALITAAAQRPSAFAGLLLVDPVVLPQARYAAEPVHREQFAAKRRNEWASVQEMVERFAGRAPFGHWHPAVLQDYCEYGLIPAGDDNGFVLACPPWVEAATYAGAMGQDPYEDIATINLPVRILRARERTESSPMDISSSPTTPDLATYFRDAEDIYLPEMTHFIPMEDPALVARHVRELNAKIVAASN